jgi:hypothetical protein
LVDETNEERDGANLNILKRNATLDKAAQLKAEDMAARGYFSHNTPDGKTPWYWFDQASYKYVHAGENLAVHFTDSSDVVDAWMKSPSHRANILNGNYREIGIGTAKGKYEGFDTVFVVQLFGTPAAASEPDVATVEPTPAPTPFPVSTPEPTNEIIEDEPEPQIAVTTPPSVAGASEDDEATTSTNIGTSSESPLAVNETPTTTEEVEVTDDGTVVYSSYVSTSTGGIPASIAEIGPPNYESTAPIASIATKPHLVLQILYILIGAFVFISLLISIIFEMRRHQSVQLAYGVGLMATMFALFYIHISLSSGVLIV